MFSGIKFVAFDDDDCVIFILTRENDESPVQRMNPDSLRNGFCFRVFGLSFASGLFKAAVCLSDFTKWGNYREASYPRTPQLDLGGS